MSEVEPAGSEVRPAADAAAPTSARGRRRRWALRALGVALAGACLLCTLLILTLVFGLEHGLNSAWVKARVQEQALERAGAALTYRTLRLRLASGLLIEDLVVQQPTAFRAHAPDLLRLRRLEIGYRPLLLLTGTLTVEALRARGVELTLVQDAAGRTSLDALADDRAPPPEPAVPPAPAPSTEPSGPPTPLTRVLELADLPLPVHLGELSLSELSLRLLTLDEEGSVARRVALQGVQVEGHASLRPGRPEAALRLSSPPEGLRFTMVEATPGGPTSRDLRLSLSQSLQLVDAHHVRGALRVDLHEQSFEPRFRFSGALLGLQLGVEFDPAAGDITASLSDVELLAGAARLSVTVRLHERFEDDVRWLTATVGTSGSVDLQPALQTAEPLVGPTGIEELAGTFGWTVSDLKVDLQAQAPLGGQLVLDTQIDRVRGVVAGTSLDGEGLGLRVAFAPLDDDSYRLELKVPIERLSVRSGSQRVALRRAELRVEVPEAHPAWLSPEDSWGALDLKLRAGQLALATPSERVDAATLGLRLQISRDRRAGPLRLDFTGGARELDVHQGDRLLVPIRRGTLEVTGRGLKPNLAQPIDSLGSLTLQTKLGPLQAQAELQRSTVAEARFKVDLEVASLALLGTLLPRTLRKQIGQVPYGRVSALVRTEGVVDPRGLQDLSRLRLRQTARVELRNLSLRRPDLKLSVALLGLDLKTRTEGRARQEAEFSLQTRSPRVDGRRFRGPLGLQGRLSADLHASRARLVVDNLPAATHRLHLDASATLRRPAHTLDYVVEAELGRLGGLLRLAGSPQGIPVDLARLEIQLRSEGKVEGLVRRVVRGVPELHADPLPRLRGQQETTLQLGGLLVDHEGLHADVPKLKLTASSTGGLEDLQLDAGLEVAEATVDQGRLHLHAKDLTQSVDLRTEGGPVEGVVHLKLQTALGSLEQDAAPEVAVGDLSLRARLRLEQLDTLRVTSVSLHNAGGGQRFKLEGLVQGLGGIVASGGRPSLSLKGRLVQDLSRLRLQRHRLEASGRVELPFDLQSEALDRLRLSATLGAQAVSLQAPKQGLRLDGFAGRVRIEQVIALPPGGPPRLVPVATRNPYSRATFADVHPYLSDDSYFSLESISLRGRTLGPIAGNLSVQRNIFGLHQIQFAVGGGKVFGACIVDFEPGNTLVLFRGKFTDIEPKAGGSDRFDGNAAVSFNVDRLELEGRVHVVRISSAHLADVLDLIDPYREDPNFNRVRMGLKVGHPRYVRLKMKDGLLALKVELGGAASLIDIEEIRGVALGPFLNRYVAPLLPPGGTRFGATGPEGKGAGEGGAEPESAEGGGGGAAEPTPGPDERSKEEGTP